MGPTAAGKTDLAIELSKSIGAEIISADSMQVYRHMDIGTAKPLKDQKRQITHHLIDILDPDQEFNAGLFRQRASDTIDHLERRGLKTVLVGGTYLYIRVLLSGIIEGYPADPEIRSNLQKLRSAFGAEYLYSRLQELDPASAEAIHPNDYVRIQRALEVYHLTGTPVSKLRSEHGFADRKYDYYKIGLSVDRDLLRGYIDRRVDRMIEEGVVEEVRALREMGYGPELKPMQSIGYKEINSYIDGEIRLETATESIKRDTKRFAKRQMTWLRHDNEINWYDAKNDFDKILGDVDAFYSGVRG